MAQGGKRQGAGRKRMPHEAKKVPIAMRVSPACADWLRDKALYYGCSLGQMVEHMMTLWREQERKYCGVKDNEEPYIKAFVSEFDKTMTQVMADMRPLTIEDAETIYQKALSIRKGGK